MLVITRREGETVVIGDPKNPIGSVTVNSIRGDRVRLAFNFPRNVPVHRSEVADEIKAVGCRGETGGRGAPKVSVVARKRQPAHPSSPPQAPATDRGGAQPTHSSTGSSERRRGDSE